jgi:hypothetical protein
MPFDPASTIHQMPAFAPPGRGLRLLVCSRGRFSVHALPEHGEVSIGREATDVILDDPSVSRQHARLLIGKKIRVRDLGSANGTTVGEQRLSVSKTAEVEPGDVIQLGTALALLQAGTVDFRTRRLWPHDYLALRAEEECQRSERSNASFALLRVQVEGVEPAQVEAVLTATFRPADLIAVDGDQRYCVLLLDTKPDGAEAARRRISGNLLAMGGVVRTGLACYPRDGRVAEGLLERSMPEGLPQRPRDDGRQVVMNEAVMRRLHRFLASVATSDVNVLLMGERGVGRSLFADKIHALSPESADHPLVRIDCGRPETMADAMASAPAQAMLFLDHVAELPLQAQAVLAQLLPGRQRVIAATHRDLAAEVARGRFRADLYACLSGVTLVIPRCKDRLAIRLESVPIDKPARGSGPQHVPMVQRDGAGPS